MHLVIIDNYDSFTYNLRQYIEEEGVSVSVLRNDCFALSDLERYDKIVLSPGPGIPDEAGQLKAVIENYHPHKPILGVCLGEQAIGEVFGGKLINLSHVYHGIQSPISLVGDDYIFDGIASPFAAGRYHSWVVADEQFPDDLVVTARSEEGQIMALRHRHFDVHGIQFHPESILTPDGRRIIHNFVHHS